MRSPSPPKRVLILGAGFGGAYCARALGKALPRSEVEVFLINRTDYLLYYPLLVEAGSGEIETRHATVGLRDFMSNVRFRMGEVLEIAPDKRRIRYRLGFEGPTLAFQYDHLIIALGSITRRPPIPGLREYGYQLKSLFDAMVLRDRWIELVETAVGLEKRDRPPFLHYVVVGGNFTGIELAGEINSYLRACTRRYRSIQRDDIRVTVINRSPRILKELPNDLGDYALKKMREAGVEFKFGTTIREIREDSAILTNGEILPTRTVIWCAGIDQNPLLLKSPLPKDERGYVLCASDFRVKGLDDVWAIGDCAVNVNENGDVFPATAQFAVKEGLALARNVRRALEGRPPMPANLKSAGSLAKIGHHTGVGKIFGFKFSGWFGWFLYRTVYLIKVPGVRRTIRVALDWALDLVFRRDILQFGIRHPRPD